MTAEMSNPLSSSAAYTYSCAKCGATFSDNGDEWIGHVRECVGNAGEQGHEGGHANG